MLWIDRVNHDIDLPQTKANCLHEFKRDKIPELLEQFPAIPGDKLTSWAGEYAELYFTLLEKHCGRRLSNKQADARLRIKIDREAELACEELIAFSYYRLVATSGYSFECQGYSGEVYAFAIDEEDLLSLDLDPAEKLLGLTIASVMDIGNDKRNFYGFICSDREMLPSTRFSPLTRC